MSDRGSAPDNGLWPTEPQLLLIKAALWEGMKAREAWQAWRTSVDLSEPLDPITFRLLPLLYCNMQALGEAGDEMLRLKGLYRNAWYRNNLLFHGLAPLLTELHESGFRLMFLKGLPLAVNYYPKVASRPMSDVDILVPNSQAGAVVKYMDDSGYPRHWTVEYGGDEYRHSIPFQYHGHEIDIHWHLLRDCCDISLTEEVWRAAKPFEYQGIPGWTLAPTDMLFHQILHGLRWNPEPSIRWIPDAWTVIKRHRNDIDWRRFTEMSKKYAFCERCYLGLSFLGEKLESPIPESVLADLKNGPMTLVERMERTFVLKDHEAMYAHPLGKLWITFADYQSQGNRRKTVPGIRGFSHFIRVRWRARGRLELIQSAFTGLWRRLMNRISLRNYPPSS